MHGRRAERSPYRINRRQWLALALAGGSATPSGGAETAQQRDEHEIAEVLATARRVGLGGFRLSTSRRFLALGDAPAAYRLQALQLGEALADAFFQHFGSKGFALAAPPRRLTIVTLADATSYARFSRDDRPVAYGMYDGNSNRLLVFDLRSRRDALHPRAEALNRQVLIHEAQHQLAFNSGMLLNPRADHLRGIVEGLAIYGETYRPDGTAALGEIHQERLQYLSRRLRQGARWITAEEILSGNSPFAGPSEAIICQAYAQSWLLIHYLLTEPALTPRFRFYLSAYNRGDPSRRLDDARHHLGSLTRLDQAVRRHMGHVI